MKNPLLLLLSLLFLVACTPATSKKVSQTAQLNPKAVTTIYLLRHAEKDLLTPGVDKRNPPLSKDGDERAIQLKNVLKDVGITRIFSSDYIRTQSTVQPLAASLGLPIESYNPRELEAFATQLKGMKGRILVSGHSNSTPKLTQLLGGEAGEPIVEKTEFDRLYVLTMANGQVLSSVLMRYGKASGGS